MGTSTGSKQVTRKTEKKICINSCRRKQTQFDIWGYCIPDYDQQQQKLELPKQVTRDSNAGLHWWSRLLWLIRKNSLLAVQKSLAPTISTPTSGHVISRVSALPSTETPRCTGICLGRASRCGLAHRVHRRQIAERGEAYWHWHSQSVSKICPTKTTANRQANRLAATKVLRPRLMYSMLLNWLMLRWLMCLRYLR